MKMLTKELKAKLPKIGEGDGKAYVRYFTPWSVWSWYGSEYDEETNEFYGVVFGFETEYGYFSLDELEKIEGPFGLKVERDLYYTPESLKDLAGF